LEPADEITDAEADVGGDRENAVISKGPAQAAETRAKRKAIGSQFFKCTKITPPTAATIAKMS
jgi:hypothetical protein